MFNSTIRLCSNITLSTQLNVIKLPHRNFARNTKRWVYSEQKKNAEVSHRIMKPVDGTRQQRYSQATSLDEKSQMSKADLEY
jgi:hypothetical protein